MANLPLRTLVFPGLPDTYVVRKYDDLVQTVKITGQNTTMAEVATALATIKTAGDSVLFDISAFGTEVSLCSIYIDTTEGTYRVIDIPTGHTWSGAYAGTDKLKDIVTGERQHAMIIGSDGLCYAD